MKKTFLTLLFFLSIGCNLNEKHIDGSGTTISQTRELNSFHNIILLGIGNVFITEGDSQQVTITTDDNIINYVETNVNNNAIHIKSRDNYNLDPTSLRIDIKIPDISDLNISGSGNIEMLSEFTTESVHLTITGSGDIKGRVNTTNIYNKITGSGDIEVSGFSEYNKIIISGSGDCYSDKLISNFGTVEITGSGDCTINCNNTLDVCIKGSGDTFYKGQPKITKTILGSGSIKQM